jgi:D-alanyl-D-alanine dipeptidase
MVVLLSHCLAALRALPALLVHQLMQCRQLMHSHSTAWMLLEQLLNADPLQPIHPTHAQVAFQWSMQQAQCWVACYPAVAHPHSTSCTVQHPRST